jgi:predicted permease
MPAWQPEIRRRLASLKLSPLREAEIVEELAQHLEDRYEDLLALGHAPTAAFHLSLAELSESELMVSELRRVERRVPPDPIIIDTNRRSKMFSGLWQDLRHGARSLRKNPGFSLVVVLTLALGIGANTALFSVVNGVLLKPLPYPEPDQLVTLHQSKPNFETGAIPYPNFRDLQKENRTFSAMAISRGTGFSLIGAGEAERVSGRWISADFFTVIGIQPALGRTFVPGEDESGAGPVAVISADLWQRKFGGAQDVLGKSLTLDDKSYTIVGVLPAGFTLFSNDVYVPIGQWNTPALRNRGVALGLHGIGRIKPGVSFNQAQADLGRVMSDLAAAYPDTNRGNGSKIVALEERLVGSVRSILLMLLGAVGFVLLIACVNVSNLMLARSAGRTREFALRAALGAGQWRLLRQSLIESLLLAMTGGVLGLLVAGWGTQAVLRALPETLPRAEEIRLDVRVLLFTVGVSLLTGILAGLAPALKSSRWGLSETLKEGGRGASSGRVRAQGFFVAIEMALALVLLIGAGLMIRSMAAVSNVDPGFQPDHVLTFGLSLPPSMRTATPATLRTTLRDLSDQLNSTPGVRAASLTEGATPLQGEDDVFFWIDGQPKPASQSEMPMSLVYQVEPGYLTAMGIPLRRGRFFTNQDDERSLPVAVIDEVFAQKYFGAEDPIGKRIHLDNDRDPSQIVGVVGHVEQWGLDSGDSESLQAQLYLPFRASLDDSMPNSALVVMRLDESAPPPFDSIRHVVQSQHAQNVIFRPQTMNEVIAGTLAARRFSMILLDAFAVVALLLASIGLYGVISYLVGQRTHELGIRLALGAQRRNVLRLVLGQGMRMALAGVALGLVAALGLTRLLATMLFGVSTTDPVTFAVISLLLTTVALLACFVPALRATRVDPLVALRYE